MTRYNSAVESPANANRKSLKETEEAELLEREKENTADKALSEFDKDFSNYKEVAQPAIRSLKSAWGEEIGRTEERRNLRKVKIDIEGERAKGNLEQDELYCSVRLIDSNITREHARHLQYLTKSARNVILVAQADSNVEVSLVESDFTLKGRYNGWETPFMQAIDGMETHGWDFIEIVFDKNKPGNFSNEHIGHDNLLYPTDTKDFQGSPFIVRTIDYTTKQLVTFAKKNGWDKEQVAKLLNSTLKDRPQSSVGDSCDKLYALHSVEKVFYRNEDDSFIYVGWSAVNSCDEWLREPKRLFLGKVAINPEAIGMEDKYVQLFETSYPIEPLLYSISEEKLLMSIQGRAELDEAKQDAVISLLTSYVTQARRASGLYFGTDNSNGTPLDEAQTNIKLKQGAIFDARLAQFKIDSPSPEMVNAINIIIGQSQMERGDVNYAVQSNKSTRKTSAEVKMAGSEQELLGDIKTLLLSISLRNIFTRNFDIYQSRVKAGLLTSIIPQVKLLLDSYDFIIKPAGDIDIIERQQKIELMQRSWQVMQGTAAAGEFLKDLIKLLFPAEAQRYIQAIGVDEAKNNILQAVSSLIQEVMLDPATGQIKPEFTTYAGELQQIQQAVASVVGTTQQQDSTLDIPASSNMGEGM